MIRFPARWMLVMLGVALFAYRAPAPLVYRPGEGWIYESAGGKGRWTRDRAKDQLDVGAEAFNKGDYSTAKKAARRVTAVWPQSDYAPQAMYLLGRVYEADDYDEQAFATYRDLLKKYPKVSNYEEVLQRQFDIANRFLAGQWFKLWGVVPFPTSMDKIAGMYREIIGRGPYSPIAPNAALAVGAAYERKDMLPLAAAAYSITADRYHDRTGIAAEAMFRAGLTYQKQARKAEYDQSLAGLAISTFTDFIGLYPNDVRVSEAQNIITELKAEQARGAFEIAKYYESRRRREGALVYYNEAILKAPNTDFAAFSRERIAVLKAMAPTAMPAGTNAVPAITPAISTPK